MPSHKNKRSQNFSVPGVNTKVRKIPVKICILKIIPEKEPPFQKYLILKFVGKKFKSKSIFFKKKIIFKDFYLKMYKYKIFIVPLYKNKKSKNT